MDYMLIFYHLSEFYSWDTALCIQENEDGNIVLLSACGICFSLWDINFSGSLSSNISAAFWSSAQRWISDQILGNTKPFKFLLKRTCTVRVLTPTQVRYFFDSATKEGNCELQFPQSYSVFISKGVQLLKTSNKHLSS